MMESDQFNLEDYVVEDEISFQNEQFPTPKQKRDFKEYYGISVELAVIANSLGPNCLLVITHIVKMTKKLQRFRDYVWIDPAFANHTKLSQRILRRCVGKLESAGLVSVTNTKGRFIKVRLREPEHES